METRPLNHPEVAAKYYAQRQKAVAFLQYGFFAFLAVVCLFAFVGCASIQASKNSQIETKVFAASADYNAILSVAVAYESQPRCAVGQRPLGCSDVKVVAIIRKSDLTASAALKAAEDTARTPGVSESTAQLALTAAVNAVSALREILLVHGILKP